MIQILFALILLHHTVTVCANPIIWHSYRLCSLYRMVQLSFALIISYVIVTFALIISYSYCLRSSYRVVQLPFALIVSYSSYRLRSSYRIVVTVCAHRSAHRTVTICVTVCAHHIVWYSYRLCSSCRMVQLSLALIVS